MRVRFVYFFICIWNPCKHKAQPTNTKQTPTTPFIPSTSCPPHRLCSASMFFTKPKHIYTHPENIYYSPWDTKHSHSQIMHTHKTNTHTQNKLALTILHHNNNTNYYILTTHIGYIYNNICYGHRKNEMKNTEIWIICYGHGKNRGCEDVGNAKQPSKSNSVRADFYFCAYSYFVYNRCWCEYYIDCMVDFWCVVTVGYKNSKWDRF